jgi:rhodanese-related sulfurtransferase
MYEGAEVLFPIEGLRENDEIHLGQVVLRVLHTPGHRPESLSLLVTNAARSPEPSMLLTGDCLFVGDVGRPDFGGPDATRQEYESLQKILRLEDYVEVFPAHFEGSCGKSMCGRPSSTIGFERRFNPVARLPETEFRAQLSERPARPLNMSAIVATNRGVEDYSWVRPRPMMDEASTITIDQAPSWLAEHPHAAIIDVREPEEYAAGHLPNAESIPQSDLALRLAELPTDRDLLVVCESGMRSRNASRFLLGAGYTRVVDLAGGTGGWRRAGLPVEREAAA